MEVLARYICLHPGSWGDRSLPAVTEYQTSRISLQKSQHLGVLKQQGTLDPSLSSRQGTY